MNLKKRVKKQVGKLRQLAQSVEPSSREEVLELFSEIKRDTNCNRMLYDLQSIDKKSVKIYNAHIRKSKLSEEIKEKLVI